MKQVLDIILCRPDERRSCCACCGAFNLGDISRASISGFLGDGELRTKGEAVEGIDRSPLHPRDGSAHICPFQGFAGDGSLPGCLVHPSVAGADGRERSLYGAGICETYFCPAHFLLDARAKRLLLAHIDDWYRYSIAVVDPLGFVWMLGEVHKTTGGAGGDSALAAGAAAAINAALEVHAGFLNRLKGPLFQYSQSEYLLEYYRFSPGSGSPQTEQHRRAIRETMSGLLA
jgi:hypothetical protein